MRSGNPDCFHTVSPHSSKQMKGKRTPEPRWVQTLRPTRKFTLQSSYSKWHLISDIFRTDTVKTQEVPNGSRWRTCSWGHLSVHTARAITHLISRLCLCPVETVVTANNTAFSLNGWSLDWALNTSLWLDHKGHMMSCHARGQQLWPNHLEKSLCSSETYLCTALKSTWTCSVM